MTLIMKNITGTVSSFFSHHHFEMVNECVYSEMVIFDS